MVIEVGELGKLICMWIEIYDLHTNSPLENLRHTCSVRFNHIN